MLASMLSALLALYYLMLLWVGHYHYLNITDDELTIREVKGLTQAHTAPRDTGTQCHNHCALSPPKYMEIVYEVRSRHVCNPLPPHPQPFQWSFFLFIDWRVTKNYRVFTDRSWAVPEISLLSVLTSEMGDFSNCHLSAWGSWGLESGEVQMPAPPPGLITQLLRASTSHIEQGQ